MTRLDDNDKPMVVDAVRYGELAAAKPLPSDTVPWPVFHVRSGRDINSALPDRLKRPGTKRRDVKDWCIAFQGDTRAKTIWKALRKREPTPDEASLMIEIGRSEAWT